MGTAAESELGLGCARGRAPPVCRGRCRAGAGVRMRRAHADDARRSAFQRHGDKNRRGAVAAAGTERGGPVAAPARAVAAAGGDARRRHHNRHARHAASTCARSSGSPTARSSRFAWTRPRSGGRARDERPAGNAAGVAVATVLVVPRGNAPPRRSPRSSSTTSTRREPASTTRHRRRPSPATRARPSARSGSRRSRRRRTSGRRRWTAGCPS